MSCSFFVKLTKQPKRGIVSLKPYSNNPWSRLRLARYASLLPLSLLLEHGIVAVVVPGRRLDVGRTRGEGIRRRGGERVTGNALGCTVAYGLVLGINGFLVLLVLWPGWRRVHRLLVRWRLLLLVLGLLIVVPAWLVITQGWLFLRR